MSLKATPHSEVEEVRMAFADELEAKDSTNFVGFLDSTCKDKKKLYASAELWQAPFQNTWNKQLWVSPQMADVHQQDRRMYLFGSAPKGEGGLPVTLSRFLERHVWDGGDRRLYVEVHSLPKRKEERAITGTIVNKAPPLEGQRSTRHGGANVSEYEGDRDGEIAEGRGQDEQIEGAEGDEEDEDEDENAEEAGDEIQ